MVVSVLGDAIASHLSKREGLYSVELPASLESEILGFVHNCNSTEPTRAILVTDKAYTSDIPTSTWAEVLKWRTDDDRSFIWMRGPREPDSSFRSAVKPFISSRFPGDLGCECTLDLLAEISVSELWRRRGRQTIENAFETFHRTMQWVAGVLSNSFEQAGSDLNVHWSDKFLVHWAKLLKLLDEGIANFGQILEPRHAWEIIRTAGLPVPYQLVQGSNPFWGAPDNLSEREWPSFVKQWQQIAGEFMQADGRIAVLLTSLDARVPGARKISSWRGLPWELLESLPADATAPERGMAIFAAPSSPTMLTVEFPQYPVAPVPSWWGVTDKHLEEAVQELRQAITFEPDSSCTSLVPVFQAPSTVYWLDVGNDMPIYNTTTRKWNARFTVQDIRLVYKENWRNLFVSPLPPSGMSDGDAWINPDRLSLDVKGRPVVVVDRRATAGPGGSLIIRCNLVVDYTAAIKSGAVVPDVDAAVGSWNPLSSLHLGGFVQDCIEGSWGAGRRINSSVSLAIPSPHSPTIFIRNEKNMVFAPDSQDTFAANIASASKWNSLSTPDILLQEEGPYEISVYDGSLDPANPRFTQSTGISINGSLLAAKSTRTWGTESELDDGDVFGAEDSSGGTSDIAVVKVKERAGNYSSGLLSAVRGRPAGRRPPSSQARSSLLGQYQDRVAAALTKLDNNLPNSLYQYVISSAETPISWSEHRGLPAPEFLFNRPSQFSLPGIGNGPSPEMVICPEWGDFMRSLAGICSDIGLNPGSRDFWLSGFDPSAISAVRLKDYVEVHRKLVRAAKGISKADTFWASYPLSLVIVNGSPGSSLGQLLAVLLSPLHPARLAWAFAVAFTATKGGMSQGLLGFAEGWNIPYTGVAVNSTGQEIPLVAVPTDPGIEQDFAAWSALAVLTNTGLAALPPSAADLPLPWGGRTGINQRVVERALKDYLNVHSHINSLEVAIRSVTEAPRSQEIDDALLLMLGGGTLGEANKLSGGIRIWDSDYRRGTAPTRDRLIQVRGESEYRRPFEWRSYPPATPVSADVAFVENANVLLGVQDGETSGLLGPLPLRRFCPPVLKSLGPNNLVLDQNYSTASGDDLLGLSDLLAEIEQEGLHALRSSPESQALGIGLDARWEVLGTFNMDPLLLSSVVTKASSSLSTDKRLLWEWRPSWLSQGQRNENDLAKRPYYVIARVPSSLLKALESRQGLSEAQASELLSELGYRGIGLASLYAIGGSQESAAAGFFYAMRLLLPPSEIFLQPSWTARTDVRAIHCLLPIDPVYSVLAELAGNRASEQRADLLAIRVSEESDDFTRVCLVPVEIKHHGNPQNPEALPPNTDPELKRAREQLGQMSMMIEAISKAIHSRGDADDDFAACYTKRLGFAMLLDLAMSLAQIPLQAADRARIIRNVLNGRVSVGCGGSLLLWFAPGSVIINRDVYSVDPHGPQVQNNRPLREIFLDPTPISGLWWSSESVGPGSNEEFIRRAVDQVMTEVMSECSPPGDSPVTDLRAELMQLLGLSSSGSLTDQLTELPIPSEGDGVLDVPIMPPAPKKSDQDRVDESAGNGLSSVKEIAKGPEPLTLWEDRSGESHYPGLRSNSSAGVSMEGSPKGPKTVDGPRSFIGWTSETSRWTLIGNLEGTSEYVALDLDHPKAMGIFGYMGSGKSYLLGTLIESSLEAIPGINMLPGPLSVIIFNYRRNAFDRFELSSLVQPNENGADMERLVNEYGTLPRALRDIYVLCLPGQRIPARLREYSEIPSSELLFDPSTLTVEDWELLMGDPGSEALFARTIRHALGELRTTGEITLEKLEEYVRPLLPTQSRRSADIRFRFVRKYLSPANGTRFDEILKPGRAVIIDLRDPIFTKEDALRFFLVCANHVSRVQGRFNKMIVFDEAHEYLSNEFGEKIESRIRLMRHEGTSYVFATQDVASIPTAIQRFITTKFVFSLGTRQNIEDLVRFSPEFKNQQLLGIPPGYCLVQSSESAGNLFARPRVVRIRPRITQHGGATRIFSAGDHEEGKS